jgi:hypothetical protein
VDGGVGDRRRDHFGCVDVHEHAATLHCPAVAATASTFAGMRGSTSGLRLAKCADVQHSHTVNWAHLSAPRCAGAQLLHTFAQQWYIY